MTTIFISGSREIPFVPDEVRERIDRIIGSDFDIVIGDSERGVDSAVLRYLASRAYQNVSVYTVHEKPRTKHVLDTWSVCRITPSSVVKTDKAGNVRNGREIETAKDRAMGAIADYGLVIWQSTYVNRFGNESASKGSLRNMYQLLSKGKPVVLYKTAATDLDDICFDCHELKTLKDLREIALSEPGVVARAFVEIEKRDPFNSPSLFDAAE